MLLRSKAQGSGHSHRVVWWLASRALCQPCLAAKMLESYYATKMPDPAAPELPLRSPSCSTSCDYELVPPPFPPAPATELTGVFRRPSGSTTWCSSRRRFRGDLCSKVSHTCTHSHPHTHVRANTHVHAPAYIIVLTVRHAQQRHSMHANPCSQARV